MSEREIREVEVEHYVNLRNDGARVICAHINGSGRTKVFRLYQDGLIESYQGGRFVQLTIEQTRLLRRRLKGQLEGAPCFSTSGYSFNS